MWWGGVWCGLWCGLVVCGVVGYGVVMVCGVWCDDKIVFLP